MPTIVCVDNNRFVINTHAFHNAARLRAVLPRALTQPLPLHANRNDWLRQIGQKAYDATAAKKRATNEKRAATVARKRKAKGLPARAHSSKKRRVEEDTATADSSSSSSSNEEPDRRRAPRRVAAPTQLVDFSMHDTSEDDDENPRNRPRRQLRSRG